MGFVITKSSKVCVDAVGSQLFLLLSGRNMTEAVEKKLNIQIQLLKGW